MSDFIHASLEKQDCAPQESGASPFQCFVQDHWGPKDNCSAQSGSALLTDRSRLWQTDDNLSAPIPQLPDSQVLTNFKDIPVQQLKTEVTAQVTVTQLLPDFDNPRNGLKHEQFIVQTDDGQKEFVAHDLNYADRVPLTVGEQIKLRGEWIPTPDGENHGGTETIGVLHWTHHSESEAKHPSGYIEADGHRYS